MKEELVHMSNNGNKKQADDIVVSVNTQMMIGVVIVGVVMFRVNHKLTVLARSQIAVLESIKQMAEGVMSIDETLNNVPVKVMAAKATEEAASA